MKIIRYGGGDGQRAITAGDSKEWGSIANYLRTAAERFKEDAEDIRRVNLDGGGHIRNDSIERLAKQFDEQEKEALKIAMYIEENA